MKLKDSGKGIMHVCFAACLIIIFIHALFVFSNKKGFFLDEALTFQLSNNHLVSVDLLIDALKNDSLDETIQEFTNKINGDNEWLSREEIDEEYTTLKSGKFNFLNLYILQAADVHPPLYYFLINLLCSLFPRLSLFWIGFIINISALLITCIMLYFISREIFENSICAIATMAYYGLSFDFVNNATYYRMYALLTMWCMILLYMYIKWYLSGFEDKSHMLRKICLVEFAGMLTQYFALFFILPLFVVTIVLMVKDRISVKRYLANNVITGVVYVIVWPFSLVHMLFSDRGKGVTENLANGGGLHRLLGYRESLQKSVFSNVRKIAIAFLVLAIICICFELFLAIKRRTIAGTIGSRHFNLLLYVAAPAAFYYVAAALSVPWFVDRYIMPIIPLISLFIVFVLEKPITLLIRNKNVSGILIMAIAIFLCVLWHSRLEPYYLYNSSEAMEYRERCVDLEAIVIDDINEKTNFDVEINYLHPRIFESDNEHLDTLEKNINIDKEYYVYVRKEKETVSEEVVSKTFENMGYIVEEEKYVDEFYKIFHVYH